MRRLAACLAAASVAVAASAAADSPVPALRERLAAARETHSELPAGVFASIEYTLDVSERIRGRYQPESILHAQRADKYLGAVEKGKDPFRDAAGEIFMRGYRSPISELAQGYGIYLPPNYDPERAYPLLIMMHGGSANGNLFLGVVLGNNMNWKTYREHLWDAYSPRWTPDWIVVSPDGFGQVMWRWMGEQDVLDVLADVQKHYRVDPNRIVLGGLSNGGVGAYNIGMRHAWRFAGVTAIAGAPSWVQYAGGNPDPLQLSSLLPMSGMSLAENAFNTDFRYYHGRTDTGPMKPRFVEAFGQHIRTLDVPFKEKWYDAGHDLLYLVHRHGKIYDKLASMRRDPRPPEVRLLTGDYRAPRQHWLEVTRLTHPPDIARLTGKADRAAVHITVDEHAQAFMLHAADVPWEATEVEVHVNGERAYAGPRAALGTRFHLIRSGATFVPGFPRVPEHGLEKRPGLSGPLPDAYHGSIVHVYGTAKPDDTKALKRAAERGAKGFPLWLWGFRQKVMADSEVTDAVLGSNHVMLYGTPGANTVLERVADKLPIRVEDKRVVLGNRTLSGKDLGTRFIYPNPLAPHRYVIVQAGVSTKAVQAGLKLPDFLPDYVVYDQASTRTRPRLLFNRSRMPPAMGYFDRHWQLDQASDDKGADDLPSTTDTPKRSDQRGGPHPGRAPREGAEQGLVPSPPAPPKPTTFDAPANTQAGRAARQIARRMNGLVNFRAKAPFATWRERRATIWRIDSNRACMRRLKRQGVFALPHDGPLKTPVPTPVEVRGRVNGVWFRNTHEERTLLMSCEMASRLPEIATIARRHGVLGIDIMSAYRPAPFASYHTLGLGLDLLRFWTARGVMSVLDHFEETPTTETCEAGRGRTWQARALLDIACRLHGSGKFQTVLTPNYNDGHRDHFHLDARPADPRLFLR